MRKLLIIVLGVLVVTATLPVQAGPDWDLIERARKARRAEFEAQQTITMKQCEELTKKRVSLDDRLRDLLITIKECRELAKKFP